MSDLKKLYLDIHNKMSAEHGFSSKALWGSENSQRIRFEVLTKCIDFSKSEMNILDIGSGLGHLYGFLNEQGLSFNYTGLEINQSFFEQSKCSFPNGNFILGDVSNLKELEGEFDYSFASGIYNLGNRSDTQKCFIDDCRIIFNKTKEAFSVNFLSTNSKRQDEISVYHDPCDIIALIQDKITNNYEVFHNYLPNDFTITIYK